MKHPKWDDCKQLSSSQTPNDLMPLMPVHFADVGMTVTAIHQGINVDIRIDKVVKENVKFEGVITRIHSDDETSGNLSVSDQVAISIEYICHIDHDKSL